MAALLVLPAAAQAEWGAISINETSGHTSVAFGYATESGAKIRSQAECGSGCHVGAWIRDGFAVLVHMSNGRFKAGLSHATRADAIRMARRRAGEPRAPLYAWVYSG